jgi:hypothetical protein
MGAIPGFTNLNGDIKAFAEEITDTDSVLNEVPFYDKNENKFKFENGYFFECITMKSSGYLIVNPEDEELQ